MVERARADVEEGRIQGGMSANCMPFQERWLSRYTMASGRYHR